MPANHASARVSPMRARSSVDATMSQNTTALVERIEAMPGEATSGCHWARRAFVCDVLGIARAGGDASDQKDRVAHAREPLARQRARVAARRRRVAAERVFPPSSSPRFDGLM